MRFSMTSKVGKSIMALALMLSAWSIPVGAQRPGTLEVGLFAQRTAFDELTTLAFGTSPGPNFSGMCPSPPPITAIPSALGGGRLALVALLVTAGILAASRARAWRA